MDREHDVPGLHARREHQNHAQRIDLDAAEDRRAIFRVGAPAHSWELGVQHAKNSVSEPELLSSFCMRTKLPCHELALYRCGMRAAYQFWPCHRVLGSIQSCHARHGQDNLRNEKKKDPLNTLYNVLLFFLSALFIIVDKHSEQEENKRSTQCYIMYYYFPFQHFLFFIFK